MQLGLLLVLELAVDALYLPHFGLARERVLPLGARVHLVDALDAVGIARQVVFTLPPLEDQRFAHAAAPGRRRPRMTHRHHKLNE